MKTYGIGIIGYGGFGQFVHQAWNNVPGLEVMAIADLRRNLLPSGGQVLATTDWKTLLEDQRVDIVVIVTEPSTHEEIAVAALEKGKAVLVEKPLAQNSTSAEVILKARDRYQGVAAIDLIMRFNPLLRELKRLTASGVFGNLRRVDVENYAQDESLPGWFWDRSRSGGILVEHAVHFIDLVHFLFPAEVIEVNGMTHTRSTGEQDQVMANILYAGGLIATHYHSFARPGFFEKTRIRLSFDLADIDLHGWIPLGGEASILVNRDTRALLEACPYFVTDQAVGLDRVQDDSRPEGWGLDHSASGDRRTIKAGGIPYTVSEMITGRFDLGRSKLDVYAECVRESLLDVCARLSDPHHALTAPLEAGLKCLTLGEQAASIRK